MDLLIILTKWFWLICIIVMFLNGGIFHFRANTQIKKNPELSEGYRTIIKGFVTWGNIPWIIMGVGCLIGGVPNVFHYLRPADGNLYVLAFFCSVFLIWILFTHWLFFREGAQILVNHPGIFNFNFNNPNRVKLFWIGCLAGGILAVGMIFTQSIPIPIK